MTTKYEHEMDYMDASYDDGDGDDGEFSNNNTTSKKSGESNTLRNHTATTNCYLSNGCRSRIRNARTGAYYNFYVGDKEETTLFRVIDATGFYGNKDPNKLYYDSPEEYMEHRAIQIDEDTLTAWKVQMDNYIASS